MGMVPNRLQDGCFLADLRMHNYTQIGAAAPALPPVFGHRLMFRTIEGRLGKNGLFPTGYASDCW